VIPHVLLVAGAPITTGSGPAATLGSACGRDPGIACRFVWDVSHDGNAAQLTNVYLAGPLIVALHVAYVLVLALIVRAVTHRAIKKITGHAAEADTDAAHFLFRERRRQRAQALGSVLRSATSVIIFVIAGITIAGDLGLNLAPVLASARCSASPSDSARRAWSRTTCQGSSCWSRTSTGSVTSSTRGSPRERSRQSACVSRGCAT
jgi:hypothetical protein